jgi:hypothetical protein
MAIAPEDDIQPPLTFYYNLGMNDVEISKQMKDHYDTDIYGLRYSYSYNSY